MLEYCDTIKFIEQIFIKQYWNICIGSGHGILYLNQYLETKSLWWPFLEITKLTIALGVFTTFKLHCLHQIVAELYHPVTTPLTAVKKSSHFPQGCHFEQLIGPWEVDWFVTNLWGVIMTVLIWWRICDL